MSFVVGQLNPEKLWEKEGQFFVQLFSHMTWSACTCVCVPWEVRIIPMTVFVHNHGELWIKLLKAKKLLFRFQLLHWLSNMIAVPMQQSDTEMEHFYSQSVPSKQTIVAMSTTMVSFASMLWEQKRCVSISDCFVVCPWLWQFQWANQKWKQSFSACRAMMQSLPLSRWSGCSEINHQHHCFPVWCFVISTVHDNAICMFPLALGPSKQLRWLGIWYGDELDTKNISSSRTFQVSAGWHQDWLSLLVVPKTVFAGSLSKGETMCTAPHPLLCNTFLPSIGNCPPSESVSMYVCPLGFFHWLTLWNMGAYVTLNLDPQGAPSTSEKNCSNIGCHTHPPTCLAPLLFSVTCWWCSWQCMKWFHLEFYFLLSHQRGRVLIMNLC